MLRCLSHHAALLAPSGEEQHVAAHAHGDSPGAPRAAGFHTAATRRPADSNTATPGMSSRCLNMPALGPLRVAVVAVPARKHLDPSPHHRGAAGEER